MIELSVEDYCQECPEFDPETTKNILRSWDDSKLYLSTNVFCKYAHRCKAMEKHFNKEEQS